MHLLTVNLMVYTGCVGVHGGSKFGCVGGDMQRVHGGWKFGCMGGDMQIGDLMPLVGLFMHLLTKTHEVQSFDYPIVQDQCKPSKHWHDTLRGSVIRFERFLLK